MFSKMVELEHKISYLVENNDHLKKENENLKEEISRLKNIINETFAIDDQARPGYEFLIYCCDEAEYLDDDTQEEIKDIIS